MLNSTDNLRIPRECHGFTHSSLAFPEYDVWRIKDGGFRFLKIHGKPSIDYFVFSLLISCSSLHCTDCLFHIVHFLLLIAHSPLLTHCFSLITTHFSELDTALIHSALFTPYSSHIPPQSSLSSKHQGANRSAHLHTCHLFYSANKYQSVLNCALVCRCWKSEDDFYLAWQPPWQPTIKMYIVTQFLLKFKVCQHR